MKFAFLVIAIFINFFNQSLIKSEEKIFSAKNKIENIARTESITEEKTEIKKIHIVKSGDTISSISKLTSSGTICINDVLLPVLIPNLPFGGVGQSGIGKFHGEEGFRNFSNQKSITFKGFLFDLNLRYPPYERVKKFLKFIFQV